MNFLNSVLKNNFQSEGGVWEQSKVEDEDVMEQKAYEPPIILSKTDIQVVQKLSGQERNFIWKEYVYANYIQNKMQPINSFLKNIFEKFNINDQVKNTYQSSISEKTKQDEMQILRQQSNLNLNVNSANKQNDVDSKAKVSQSSNQPINLFSNLFTYNSYNDPNKVINKIQTTHRGVELRRGNSDGHVGVALGANGASLFMEAALGTPLAPVVALANLIAIGYFFVSGSDDKERKEKELREWEERNRLENLQKDKEEKLQKRGFLEPPKPDLDPYRNY